MLSTGSSWELDHKEQTLTHLLSRSETCGAKPLSALKTSKRTLNKLDNRQVANVT